MVDGWFSQEWYEDITHQINAQNMCQDTLNMSAVIR